MDKIDRKKLKTLYRSSEITEVWEAGQNQALIEHPEIGWISPNHYRSMYKGKPCPYCGKKMLQGKDLYSTSSKKEAIARGYEYRDENGNPIINEANKTFFHPNYLTLDHKINKARCPEKMFDHDNLEAICWQCNRKKSDNNAFEIQYIEEYLECLSREAIERYPLL